MKAIGNQKYGLKNYGKAAWCYRRSIFILENVPVASEKEESQRNDLLFILYLNLAQSYLKLKRYPQACSACKLALRSEEGQTGEMLAKVFYRLVKFEILKTIIFS